MSNFFVWFFIFGFVLVIHHTNDRAETFYDFQNEASRDAYLAHLMGNGFLNLDGEKSSIDGMIVNPFQET